MPQASPRDLASWFLKSQCDQRIAPRPFATTDRAGLRLVTTTTSVVE